MAKRLSCPYCGGELSADADPYGGAITIECRNCHAEWDSWGGSVRVPNAYPSADPDSGPLSEDEERERSERPR
jgi:hypothetical protein